MAQQHLKIVRLVMTVTMKWRDSEYLGGVFVRVRGGGGVLWARVARKTAASGLQVSHNSHAFVRGYVPA